MAEVRHNTVCLIHIHNTVFQEINILAYNYYFLFSVSIFLALVAHSGSEDISEDEPYAPSLVKIFDNQRAVGELNKSGQFISLGYTYNPGEMCFNTSQRKAIQTWINKYRKVDNNT